MAAPSAYLMADIEIEMTEEAKHSETLQQPCLKYIPCLQRLLTIIATDGSFSLCEGAERRLQGVLFVVLKV